jgi:hypothetical protein
MFLLVATFADARPYTLLWDANADDVTEGYIVFYGTASNTYQPVEGIDVGNVTDFQLDLTPGQTYYFRVQAYDATHQVGPASDELVFAVPPPSSVQLSSVSVAGGSTVTATVSNGPGNRFDWVGFYPLANSHGGFLPPFKYLNNLETPPASGMTGGAVQFTVPTQPGQYNVRFFSDGSYTLLATSATITVLNAASITASTNGAAPGATVTGSVQNGPAGRFDWVGLHPVANSHSGYTDWKYLNGTQTPPATGSAAADVAFTMPTTPGQYNLRFFENGSYTLLSTSATINVASVVPSTTTIAGGGTVTAAIAFGPGSRFDWVGLYPIANSPSGYIAFKYLNGTQTPPGAGLTSANVNFVMPAQPGQYNIRFFANDTYVPLGASATITVVSAASLTPDVTTVAPGGNVTVTLANGPGNRFDWIGLYSNGGGGSGYIDWKYLNGTQVAPATGVSSGDITFTMPSTPGTYTLKLYSNGTYTQLASSGQITVQ